MDLLECNFIINQKVFVYIIKMYYNNGRYIGENDRIKVLLGF